MSYLDTLLQGIQVEYKGLGDVVELSNIGVDKKSNANEIKVRLLNFVDVFKNQYISNETPTMVVTASEKKIIECNIKQGDIFITPSSELIDEIGFSAMAIEDFDNAVYSYHIMRLRIYDKTILAPAFLNYLFGSSEIRKQILSKAQGITRYGLTQPNWKSIQIPIPTLTVQKEIVGILDKMTELKAELTAELTARKKQYNFYREQLLSFEEGEVEWKSLRELTSLITKGTTPKNYTDNGIAFIKTEAFDGTYINRNKLSFIDEETHKKELKRSILDHNDILITIAGATIGKCAIVPKEILPANTNQALAIIRLNPDVNLKYVFHLIKSNYLTKYIEQNIKGSAQPNLNLEQLNNFTIPYPSPKEQERIVSILDKFDILTTSISEGLPKEIELRKKQYEYYRDKLLTFPKHEN